MTILQKLLAVAFLGAINHQVTYILVSAGVFAPLRERAMRRNAWLGELVGCHLCMGTWVGFWMALVFRPGFVRPREVEAWSPSANAVYQGVVTFFADAFVIALMGRLFNEVLAIFQREVRVKEEAAELLDELEHEVEMEALSSPQPSAPAGGRES